MTRRPNNLHSVTEKLVDVSESTLDRLDATVENFQRQGKAYSKDVEKYVKSNPNKSIGLAFGAGFAFAILLRGWLK